MKHPYETPFETPYETPMKRPYEKTPKKHPPRKRGLPNIVVGNEHAELPTGTSRPSLALISDEESGCGGPSGDLSSKIKNRSKT